MKTAKKSLISLICVATLASQSLATIFLDEPFTYSDGQLTDLSGGANVSGGNWLNLSGTGSPLQILSGKISGVTHGSASREDATRAFTGTNITSGELFLAFELTATTAPAAGQDFFLTLHSLSNTTFRSRIFLSFPSVADPNSFRLGIENDGTTTSLLTSDLSLSQTYSVLLRVSLANNTSSLWVDTNFGSFNEASPDLSDLTAPSVQGLGRVTIRQGDSITNSNPNAVTLDNLKITDNFAQAIPEPSAALLLLAATGIFSIRRRKA